MSTTLESLARACHQALATDQSPAARERVATLVAEALKDRAFVQSQFPAGAPERKVVYEDPELGFCILAHEYRGPKEGLPHDHGPSWAIYGQAEGETMMSDYTLVEPAAPGQPARIRKGRSYALGPGDVHVYNEGAVHAPSRQGPTRLIRVEGVNMEKVARGRYQLA
ncbi:hypothetical protein HHL11_12680 [Ramlibacter sp. G-1-2-2]|uniref:Cysteine dioxygenase n=1 Tax=Ramlibacter agri TaxID=2728837 RepID=A0A848H7V0_9BURK|nr:hypothetical protein [Ramlibacter agri]NML44613.1 hypothetical protein [Ramlibacter agri]